MLALVKKYIPTIMAVVFLVACSAPKVELAETADPAQPEDSKAIQVMVLGTYHMGNPGLDVVNMKADDVLVPERQRELGALAEALARFKPTMIMVESQASAPDYIDSAYTEYKPENLLSLRDERVQIAYRIAAYLEFPQVYGIDEQPGEGEPDYFPFGKVMALVDETGQTDTIQADIAKAQASSLAFEKQQKEKTIAELLVVANSTDYAGASFYYDFFKYDRGESQPGAELQAYWFMRNAKIFGKLTQLAKPGDRVLVVYGAGHKYWLEHFASQTSGYIKVDPVPYLKMSR